MKIIITRNRIQFIGYSLMMVLIAALTLGMTACSSKTSTPTLSSITIAPTSTANLTVGSSQQFTATGAYSNGSTADVSSQVTWDSSNTTVATISSAGLAIGMTAGTTNITAFLAGEPSQTLILTVVDSALSSIAVMRPPNLIVGSTQQLIAIGTYSDGSNADVTSQVTWAGSNDIVASISSSGLATGVAVGTTKITAALSGVASTAITLTVIDLAPSSITVTPASPVNLIVGSAQQFAATETYTDGTTANISSKVIWASSNMTIATISSTGLTTGSAAGTTNITASLQGVTSPAVTLTVIAPTLDSIAITPTAPANLTMTVTQQFTATVTYSNGSTGDVTSQVTWNSSNPTVAPISPTGLAIGMMAGTTNITAAFSGVTSSAITLVVTSPPANPASQTISFIVSPTTAAINTPFTVSGASASSGLKITYTIKSGMATISGSTITPTDVGALVIEASQAGDADYNAATPVDQTIIVGKANQTISFKVTPSTVDNGKSFIVSGASASSGLTITYTIKSGPATIFGTTITPTGSGSVVVEASQAGNAQYNAATPVDQTIKVGTPN